MIKVRFFVILFQVANLQREHQFKKPKEFQPCYRCGKNDHMPTQCRFISAICNKCGKRGHIAPACKTKPEFRRQSHPNKKHSIHAHYVEQELQEETEHEESTSENELHLFAVSGECRSYPIKCSLTVEGIELPMTVDTGAEVSLLLRRLEIKSYLMYHYRIRI